MSSWTPHDSPARFTPAGPAASEAPQALQRLRVRVRYAETDQMGVVYHAHYLVWMEVGRTELLRAIGHPYDELERQGLLFAVSDVSCRFVGAARYGDVVEVETRVAEVRSRTVGFAYRIARENGESIAHAAATVVALGRDRRLRRIPEALLAALRSCRRDGKPAFEDVLLA
jgi:acyl-CoA thioester hydrolase